MYTNRPPNTRVQRTRSSPSALRSPLTRCPLGAGKLRCWLVCVCLLDAFWALGCHMGPSLEAYRAHLAKSAGVSAADCGCVMSGTAKAEAVACATAGLEGHRPFFVVFQGMGVDSEIVHG